MDRSDDSGMTYEIVADLPDARDFKYASAGKPPTPTADLRRWAIDVEDQLFTNSCTAHAGTSALELLATAVFRFDFLRRRA